MPTPHGSIHRLRELTEHYKSSDVIVLGATSPQGKVAGLEPARIDTRGNPETSVSIAVGRVASRARAQQVWRIATGAGIEEVLRPC